MLKARSFFLLFALLVFATASLSAQVACKPGPDCKPQACTPAQVAACKAKLAECQSPAKAEQGDSEGKAIVAKGNVVNRPVLSLLTGFLTPKTTATVPAACQAVKTESCSASPTKALALKE